ncbi:MAG: GNAT family N-acetyltransferase [Anaerovoracaceae bacterium]
MKDSLLTTGNPRGGAPGQERSAAGEVKQAAGQLQGEAGASGSSVRIRIVREEDAEELLAIYAPYVRETAISFEYEVPTVEEFRSRIRGTLQRYPYLAAERDGVLLGYAYAGPFKQRAAYDRSVEMTVYVRQDQRGTGVGTMLYRALERVLDCQNILNVNACIGVPLAENDPNLTADSPRFHAWMGYREVGTFHRCGYKFGRWYSMMWMEKFLREHPDHPEPVIPFSKLDRSGLFDQDGGMMDE